MTSVVWLTDEQFTTKWHRLKHSEIRQKRTGQYQEYEDRLFRELAGPPFQLAVATPAFNSNVCHTAYTSHTWYHAVPGMLSCKRNPKIHLAR